ncbi:cache domain-containing protein [Rhizobium sp. FY34]|uniref:cache domain-containing protein n=1 Tax=Rhizobium sp. FY34 TaxID=2562309 RepID=UPI0010BFA492|nr:cache domain-containing protein [Rhizobium sp. FY34]
MTIDRLLAAIAAFSVASVLLLGGWLMMADQQALLADARQREIDQTAVVFTTAMDQAAILSATHSEALASDPQVRALLKAGSRAEMQLHAKPIFDRLARLAGIDVVHFHDAQMRSFLRVWEPQNFGQDLSTFRPMVVAANHDRQTQKGLELGIRGLSLRAVSPVMDNDGKSLVGTVEVGVNLQALADLAKAASGSDFALVLDPRYMRDGNGAASSGIGLALDAATDKALFDQVIASGAVHLSRSNSIFSYSAGDRSLTFQSKPLIDYSGNVIGVILTARDFSRLEAHYNRSAVTLGSIFLTGLLIVFSIIMVAIRAAIVRPLAELAHKVETMPHELDDTPPSSGLTDFRRLHRAVSNAVSDRNGPRAEG